MRYLSILFLGLLCFSNNLPVTGQDAPPTSREPIPLSAVDSSNILIYEQAYEQALERGAYRDASAALNQIAFLYWNHNLFGQAITYYKRSIKENEKIGNVVGIGKIQNNLGMLYADLKNYPASIEAFEQALSMRRQAGNREAQIDPLINQSVSYQHLGERGRQDAIRTVKQALEIATEIRDLSRVRLCYGMLAEIHKKGGQADSAFKYFELYRTFYNKAQEEELSLLQEEAEQAALKARIARLEQEKQQMEIRMQQKKLQEQQKQLATYDSTSNALYQNLNRQELLIRLLEEEQKNIQREKEQLLREEELQQRIFLSLGGGALLALLLLWRAYVIKQKANRELSDKNAEIWQQREEIQQQAESLKTANVALRRLDRFKQNMIHMIAHDLKNPLNTIIGYTQAAESAQGKAIHRSGYQMLHLISNMLDVQRLKEASVVVSPQEIELGKLYTKVRDQVRFLTERKGVALESRIPEGVGVRADPDLLSRVLVNLITNAIKYTEEGGRVSVYTTAEAENQIRIAIQDNGVGIDPEYHQRIFEPYEQQKGENLGVTPSTGLGLTFCKMAVEAQQGQIGVNSTPGQGSTFWFTLPKAAALGTSESANQEVDPAQEPLHIAEGDRRTFRPVVDQLQKLEVYQTTKVTALLEEIVPKNTSNGLHSWKEAMRQAVLQLNEARYNELLKVFTREEKEKTTS